MRRQRNGRHDAARRSVVKPASGASRAWPGCSAWSVFHSCEIGIRFNAAQGVMRMQVTEVASVSPGRMFGAGMAHLLIGLTWSIGPIVGFFADTGEARAQMRPEVIAIVVILWPLGVPILLRGLGLLQQSLGGGGSFRATADGIELRLGGPTLYARLIAMIPQFRWLPA